jgi:5-methylcytosine-specific restriction endonuclease McrA
LNFIKVVKYLTTTENDHYLYFTLNNYKKYKWVIWLLLLFNKNYRSCKIFRKTHKYHKNIVVVGLKYYGRNVKRRTNGYAREFLEENPDSNCPYCDTKLTESNITADHIIVVSGGGNNSRVNLLACCKSCNEERGDEEFYRYLYQKKPGYKKLKYPFV